MQAFDDGIGGLILSSAGWIDHHDRASIGCVVVLGNPGWTIVAVTGESDIWHVRDDQLLTGPPGYLDRGKITAESHDYEVTEFERVPILIGEGCVQHELQGKTRATIGGFSLDQVNVPETSRVSWPTGIMHLHDHRGQLLPIG